MNCEVFTDRSGLTDSEARSLLVRKGGILIWRLLIEFPLYGGVRQMFVASTAAYNQR
ncbi:hypothetical protein Xmau_01051 [Xenorhabdus mauleonii]|uniref:Uncharacterized protein n=1 Tax=Xenorhabdus mauleonii TaxID=351675 RepID=A0A1I3M4Z5_9GAMM|nr:hypothetical protein Xmau_01051 [Xenorhabdus mauleonii]SFI91997.1 hypothetical protein SAMN05421680_104168 [Xenorhabdus mauleonii]